MSPLHRRDDASRIRQSASKIRERRRNNWHRCANWCAAKWKRGRSESDPSLIYAPAFYASTEELIEMCKVAAQYKGKYISHMRSEGNRLIEAVEELLRISREANIPAEIYHLKAAGKANWGKMDQVLAVVEKARRDGLKITADYVYLSGRVDGSRCVDAAVGTRWRL
jgi:hypothetical protein